MNTLPLVARLVFAAAASVTTLLLFSGVVAFSEPQRSVLVASVQQRHAVAAMQATPTVAMADSTQRKR